MRNLPFFQFITPKIPTDLQPILAPFFDLPNLDFKIKGNRNSKLGDFRSLGRGQYAISLNRTLSNKWFTLTLCHEIAHYQVATTYKRRVKPHGDEWKFFMRKWAITLANLYQPEDTDFAHALYDYAKNPAASVNAHKPLYAFFLADHPEETKKKEEQKKYGEPLSSLPIGATFNFKGETYQLQGFRRTRAEITHLKSKKSYLLSGKAYVASVEKKPLKNTAEKPEVKEQPLATLAVGEKFKYSQCCYIFKELRRSKVVVQKEGTKELYLVTKDLLVTKV
ncbi:MAG: SprT-like domain-containing protein [Luteibaculaceae bacterium]